MSAKRVKYNQRSGALQEAMAAPAVDFELAQTNLEPAPMQSLARRRAAAPPREEEPSAGATVLRGGVIRRGFFTTIEEGHRALVTEKGGQVRVVEGPARLWTGGRRIRPMEQHLAHPGEFLVVRHRDGRQEHRAGPTSVWFDPRQHASIEKEDALQVSAEEAVVVYSEAADGSVERRIAPGPATFVPQAGEWLHTFSWHGTVGGQKVANALVFQKLWLLPDQMYHDVAEVRTADDAVITVRLMIFFHLQDIAKLLATSHDPIGDFVNAATSDVVEFARRHTFDQFKQSSDQLNDLATYRQLVARAEQCGYRIGNVVYRGYGAPPALQAMHQKATESRTRLQLEKATEQQAQELEDLKQERALARRARQRAEAAEDHEAKTALRRREREEEELERAAQRAHAAAEDARQQAHLGELSALGVDLTALLTAGRADRVIELRGTAAGHVHLDG
jgi:hypothetical protein